MSRMPRLSIPSLVLAAGLAAFAPAGAHALQPASQADFTALSPESDGVSFSIGASAGVVEGTATELAFYYPYDRKFKLSELTWDLKDVAMAGVHGSLGFGRRFRVNLGVWSALNEGSGEMVDRDWVYPDYQSAFMDMTDDDWTDESRHPDTSLDEGTILDVNVSILAHRSGAFSLRGLVGYLNETWRWSARGGTYTYSTVYYGSRDYTGSFTEGEKVIDYEQQFSIPYLGVGVNWTWPSFQLESHLLYSPLVSATDTDYHVLRGVYFEGDFSGGTYVGVGLNATWAFAPNWSATFGVAYQDIPEMTGDVSVTGDEGTGSYADGGGIAMSAASASLGAAFRF